MSGRKEFNVLCFEMEAVSYNRGFIGKRIDFHGISQQLTGNTSRLAHFLRHNVPSMLKV
jgi:hypothetical protein